MALFLLRCSVWISTVRCSSRQIQTIISPLYRDIITLINLYNKLCSHLKKYYMYVPFSFSCNSFTLYSMLQSIWPRSNRAKTWLRTRRTWELNDAVNHLQQIRDVMHCKHNLNCYLLLHVKIMKIKQQKCFFLAMVAAKNHTWTSIKRQSSLCKRESKEACALKGESGTVIILYRAITFNYSKKLVLEWRGRWKLIHLLNYNRDMKAKRKKCQLDWTLLSQEIIWSGRKNIV